ncbi:MAG: hypothetical protein E6I72_11835 [Chloroflexi bacterium]|nr:MAG: hypothetical protein E6I72_11835 [Chloroflexota bacterium]
MAAFGERILAVGPRARATAGRGADVVRLSGMAWPGLIDAHIHLEGLADAKLSVDLTGTASLSEALARIREWAGPLPKDAWVVGSGWYNDAWPDASFPSRRQLDAAVGGRPAYLRRKDGHSAWVSTAALRAAAVSRETDDPAGGSIDRDEGREPTGMLRETAMGLVARLLPVPGEAELDGAMDRVLGEPALRLGRRLAADLGGQGIPRRFPGQPDGGDARRLGHRRAPAAATAGDDRAMRASRAQRLPARHRRRRRPARTGRAGGTPERLERLAASDRARAVRPSEGHGADGANRRHRFDAAHPCRGGPGDRGRNVESRNAERLRMASARAGRRQAGVRIGRAGGDGRPAGGHRRGHELAQAGDVAPGARPDTRLGAEGLHVGRRVRGRHGGRPRVAAPGQALRPDRGRWPRRRRHRRGWATYVAAKARLSFSAV